MKIEEDIKRVFKEINESLDKYFSPKGKIIFIGLISLALLASVYFGVTLINKNNNEPAQLPEVNEIQPNIDEKLPKEDKMTEIDIEDVSTSDEKMVSLSVENYGRSNPFLPSNESLSLAGGFELMAPPSTVSEGSEAAKVMETKVSGIMYEPKSPSAILNIEGSDYLVRSGDYINNYKVLSISKDLVTVQLGANVYKARVGEVISDAEVNYNEVYNLQNRFGGAKK